MPLISLFLLLAISIASAPSVLAQAITSRRRHHLSRGVIAGIIIGTPTALLSRSLCFPADMHSASSLLAAATAALLLCVLALLLAMRRRGRTLRFSGPVGASMPVSNAAFPGPVDGEHGLGQPPAYVPQAGGAQPNAYGGTGKETQYTTPHAYAASGVPGGVDGGFAPPAGPPPAYVNPGVSNGV